MRASPALHAPGYRQVQYGVVSHVSTVQSITARTCQSDHVESHVVQSAYDVHVECIAGLGHLRLPNVTELACLIHEDVRDAAYLRGAKGRVLRVGYEEATSIPESVRVTHQYPPLQKEERKTINTGLGPMNAHIPTCCRCCSPGRNNVC